jgi:hypothetical protein
MASSISLDRGWRVAMTRQEHSAARYEIRVRGLLDERWSDWFGGLTIFSEGEDATLIAGLVPDQAALHGILTKINDLGLVLESIQRVER